MEEAKLNLITCQRLAERLQADGAEIIWAKHDFEPVTHLRPADLHREAIAALALPEHAPHSGYTPSFLFGIALPHMPHRSSEAATEERIDNEAALLFYRVAEIRARGDVVNKQHPDLTICVHYNADDWGDPDHPTLTGHSRLVIFTNGAYEKSELAYDDYKYDLLRKLLDRTAVQEERGCALVGQSMLDTLKYPPESYPGSYFAHHVTDVPSVYARDLLANRIYHGPVIYCEGPYMNARDAYYRIIAGDYLGHAHDPGPERAEHLSRLRRRRGEGRAGIFRRKIKSLHRLGRTFRGCGRVGQRLPSPDAGEQVLVMIPCGNAGRAG